ncbi:MAG: DUF1858 domain-containing protein [Clostridiaceae bacterium]|nr:DUF1858 domain-containing protein [Clostridiaceae bacterium]
MNEKILNMKKTVFELVSEYPEVKDILKNIGFESITNPVMLKTAGKVMTIPKGAKMKGIELSTIVEKFSEKGFTVIH